MWGFVLRRLALVIPTFLGITLLAFSLIHLIPGDPVQVMAGERRLDPAFHAEGMQRLGLDRPLWEQYVAYLGKAVRLDLGDSFVTQEPVWREFAQLFPATLELSLCALVMATVLGLGAGVLAAVHRVAQGQSLIDPQLTQRVVDRIRERPEQDPALAQLTDQERRILLLIAEGLTNRQIAERMFLAEKTVKNYVSSLLAKLGMERRTQAAVFASRLTAP